MIRQTALIPAYEPEPVLLELLRQLHGAGFRCIVIDDGSGDGYAPLFQEAAAYATVLTHETNRGKGSALKTALAYLEEERIDCGTIVTLDADGQHRVADAMTVCAVAARHPGALVLGSRALRERVPLRSRVGNGITRWVYRAFTGCPVHDTQTGLRAFSRAMVPQLLEIPGARYEYEMNVLLEFARRDQPVLEVPISTVYFDRNSGSHFHTLRDSCRIYREILRFSGSSLVSFCVDYGLYSLLSVLTAGLGAWDLTISNVGARLVSASVNFTINRRVVFRGDSGVLRSAVRYAVLAAVVLAGNTWLLAWLVDMGVGRYGAKLVTELAFFLLSWTVQRCFVFRRRGKEA